MSPHFTVRRIPRGLGEILPVLALACATQIAAAEPTAPVVALAPIVRVDSDARPDESESLTPLLQARLSDDSRWRMVERARLDLLRAEWAFARDGLADTATALREIRPLGASLLLICRPEPGDLSAPSATCEVIDALTAEPLASARASLTDRPFARWYRNPPPEDIAAITAAFRTALSEALAVRAAQSGQQLVTPLFFIGPAELSGQLEAALDARLAAAPDWRSRRALRLDGSRAEALLAASGFTPDGVSTGFHVWGRFTPAGAGEPPTKLRYWIWNGVGAPEEHLARGDASALSTHILNALEKTPSPGAPASSPTPDFEATRLQLARQMIEEARALARSTGLKHDRFFSRLPADLVHEPLRAQVMRLLAAAAFLAPTDADAQELWLRTAFSRELSFSVTWGETRPVFNDHPLNAEARRLQRELIASAETFWRRSDGALDLRLLYLTFRDNPARLAAPDAFAELRRLAAIIGEPSAEEMAPHLGLLSLWLNALWKTCPEYRDREQKFERFRRQPGPPTFDPPPAETLETFETLWPLFRVLRHYLRGKGAPWSKPTDNPDHTPLRFAACNNARDAVLFLLRAGERDPGALALATDRDIRALLSDAMQQDTGGKAFSDDELWPVICKDKERWKDRVDAHLAAGGNVNHGAMDWTPLMLAINSANPDMVRHLLAKGANPKIHPQRHRNKSPLDLSDVGTLRLAWNLSYGGSFRGENEPAFAEIIKMIAPLEPVRDNQSLFFLVLRERLWLAAEAFRAVGVKPTARMREQIVTEGRLKGADLERALTLLANGP